MSDLVHILDGKTDKIIGTISAKNGDYWADERTDSLTNENQFDFVANATKEVSVLLQKRNRLVLQDEDGLFREYIIFYADQFGRTKKNIRGNASWADLAKAKVIDPQTLQGATAASSAQEALNGTEWSLGDVDYAGISTIEISAHTNPLNLLKTIASTFGLEISYRISVNGNKITGRYVDLKVQTAGFEGKEIVFGKDLLTVKRKEDSFNIVTALKGLGPEKEDGTRLSVTVYDDAAKMRWGRNGLDLIQTYEPQSNDSEMTLERLTTLTQNELKKRIDAVVSYECDAAAIDQVPGLSHEKIKVARTVRIKDDGYQPPLYLEARIEEVKRQQSNGRIKSFKIGNFKEFSKAQLEKQIAGLKSMLMDKAKKMITSYISSTKGSVLKTDADSTDLKAVVFNAGVEVDPSGTLVNYSYSWKRLDKNGNEVAGFNPTTKTITVSGFHIDEKATYVCTINTGLVTVVSEFPISATPKVGGTNIFQDSLLKRVIAYNSRGTMTRTIGEPTDSIRVDAAGTTSGGFGAVHLSTDRTMPFILNQEYVLSFEARGNVTDFSYTYFMRNSDEGGNNSFGAQPVSLSETEWKKVVLYRKGPFTTYTGFMLIGSNDWATGKWFEFRNVKLEKGNVDTDFSANPMDKENLYTWIKYATDANGTGLTDNPAGMSYLGIAYNKDSATESTNPADYTWMLYKGDKGDTGPTGASAVTGVLSNDSHTLPADSAGTVSSFTGAVTTMSIYLGATDDSANWTVAASASTGVTGSLSGKTYTVTGLSTDTGYVDLTASRTGYTSVTKRFTLSKSKQGTKGDTGSTGSPATAYWLVVDVPAIKKDASGVLTPASIVITGKSQTGTNTPANYSGRFIIAEQDSAGTWADKYTSTANEATRTYTLSGNTIKAVRVRMYLAGGTTTLLDEQVTPLVVDGAKGDKGDTGATGPTGPTGPSSGRNLIWNSLLDGYVSNSNSTKTLQTVDGFNTVKLTSDNTGTFYFQNSSSSHRRSIYESGKTYTISYEIRGSGVTKMDYVYLMRYDGANSAFPSKSVTLSDTTWTKVSHTMTAGWSTTQGYFLIGTRDYGTGVWFEVRKVQIEESYEATQYHPNPMEIEERLRLSEDNLFRWTFTGKTTIDGGQIETDSITAVQINVTNLSSLVADLGTVTAGIFRNSTSTNVIDMTAGTINFGNGKFVVDGSGNVTFSGSLSGATGSFSGTLSTTNLLVGNAGGSVQATFDAGAVLGAGKVAFTGIVSSDGATITKPLSLDIGKATSTGYTETFSNLDYIKLWAGTTEFSGSVKGNQSGGALRIQSTSGYIDVGAKNTSYAHFYTDRAKYFFDKQIMISEGILSSWGTEKDLLLQTNSTTRMTIDGTTGDVITVGTSGVQSYKFKSTDGYVRLHNSSGTEMLALYVVDTTNGHVGLRNPQAMLKWLGTAATVQVRNAADTAYGEMVASAYTVGSKREYKENIRELAFSALDKVKATKAYAYNLKADEQAKGQLGLIYEESPEELRGSEDTISLYAMNTLLWKAVQELSEQVDRLNKKLG